MANQSSNVLGQETDIRLLKALLPRLRKTFIDVGAEQGSFGQFLMAQGFSGVLFEPLPKHQKALAALTKNTAVCHREYAIDQQDGKAEFHIACDEAGKPLDFFHSLQPLQNDARVHHKQTLPVVCRSLASLCSEGVIEPAVGVLKIDTEGNDLRVLRGLGDVRADVIICEFFTKGIYNGWAEADPTGLIEKTRELGYDCCLAVRRRGSAELISVNPLSFTEREWGNLLFLDEGLFKESRKEIGQVIAEAEEGIFSQLEGRAISKRRGWRPWR